MRSSVRESRPSGFLVLTDTDVSDAGLKNILRLKYLFLFHLDGKLVYWRGRGLDVLSHSVFDHRGLAFALNHRATTELDAPVLIAEMDPGLATAKNLEALRRAGYRGVGLWGRETGDKYDWSADELERIVCPLVPATVCSSSAENHSIK